jgi:hypothetical protein
MRSAARLIPHQAPESRQLQVYWKGKVPAAVTSLAGQLDVPVNFLPAQFTQRHLVAEAQRLAGDARVATAAPKVDGSGVEVTVTTTRPTGADVLGTATVPLTDTTGQRPQNLYSRQNDIPWFWGGSRYNTPGGGCSNGFALSVPGSSNVYEISAGHCGATARARRFPASPARPGPFSPTATPATRWPSTTRRASAARSTTDRGTPRPGSASAARLPITSATTSAPAARPAASTAASRCRRSTSSSTSGT